MSPTGQANASAESAAGAGLRTCPCCGLAQLVPVVEHGSRACCVRCGTTLASPTAKWRSANRTAAVASAALILYPFAVSLPMIRVEKFGHHHDASILEGTVTLLSQGHVVVGLIVMMCSIVLPLAKLGALLVLSTAGTTLRHSHRAATYHLVEWTGRWGMLDVLLVAILVAVAKLGDLLDVSAGPGALAFGSVVVLSLIATACFDPHSLWESGE